MLLDLIKLVVNDLYKRKFSSFLTLFAISLGILTIFLIFLLSSGFSQSLDVQFQKFGTNRLYVTSKVSGISGNVNENLNDNLLKQIESRPYVSDIFPYVFKQAQFKSGSEISNSMIIGTHLKTSYYENNLMEIDKGRFPKENEKYSLVLGSLAATDLFKKDLKVGSTVEISNVKFKVVGIMKSLGNPEDDKTILANIDTIREIYKLGDKISFFDVIVDKGYDISQAQNNLHIFLENRVGKDVLDIRSAQEFLESFTFVLDIIKYTLGGIGFIALLVGALGIINTMYVIVTEKQKDIGIMKAVGARDFDILFMFVFQAGLFGLMGGILGIVLAGGVGVLFEIVAKSSGFTFLEITFDYVAAFGLLIFSFFIGVVSGYLPSKRAANTNLIDAIRK